MIKLYVPAMICGQCALKLERTVKAADAGATLDFDLPNRTVSVTSAVEDSDILTALSSAGFPAHKITPLHTKQRRRSPTY
jgi:copper chaperone